jgi:hypothetical protein
MSARASRRLAWSLAVLTPLLLLAAGVLALATGAEVDVLDRVFIWSLAVVFAAVGLLIARHQPGNAIGWLFLGAAVTAGIANLSNAYADAWVDSKIGGPELLGRTAAWYESLSWIPWILVPTTFLLLLFPDGHLVSRRWRWVGRTAAIAIGGAFVTQGLAPGAVEDYAQVQNPYGVHSPLLDPLTGLAFALMVVAIVGSPASLIVRFRRSQGELRQQIKWLAFAACVAAITFVLALILYDVVGEDVANAAIMLGVLGLPVAAAIAILRYRLYDVDVVINRALVYGALTALLAGAYLGTVLVLQLMLSGVTQGSGLAVAASTLGVAALFRPARSRIQASVDRRFYRRRYDAQITLEAFTARLRDQLELAAVSGDLRGVVRDTLQPAHVSLWLRERP